MTLIELAIAFVLRHPAVTAAIIGPRTMEQLESYLPALDVRLDDAVLDRIDEIVPPGTNVNPVDSAAGRTPRSHRRRDGGALTCHHRARVIAGRAGSRAGGGRAGVAASRSRSPCWRGWPTTTAGRGRPAARSCSRPSTPTAGGAAWRTPSGCCRRPTRARSSAPPATPSCSSARPASRQVVQADLARPATGPPAPDAHDRVLLAPSSACTARCRSTPAASARWPATSSRRPPTARCRSWPSGCSTARATSASASTPGAGSTSTGSTPTPSACRPRSCAARTASP